MAKIIDFFTGRTINVGTSEVKKPHMELREGVYYGHIHEPLASRLRNMGTVLEERAEEIQEMVEQWEDLAKVYYELVSEVLDVLDQPGYDAGQCKLEVSEEGHCWLVPRVGEGE